MIWALTGDFLQLEITWKYNNFTENDKLFFCIATMSCHVYEWIVPWYMFKKDSLFNRYYQCYYKVFDNFLFFFFVMCDCDEEGFQLNNFRCRKSFVKYFVKINFKRKNCKSHDMLGRNENVGHCRLDLISFIEIGIFVLSKEFNRVR